MTLQTTDSDWAARVAAAGVPVELLARELDSADAEALADSVLRAARDEKLSDRDLYPLLVRIWTGRHPIVDWPPHAHQIARRCAIELAVQQPCELAMSSWGPNDRSLQQARELIVSDLALVPADLLAELAMCWSQAASLDMPRDGAQTLLAFAQHVLLEPLVGACALMWSTQRPTHDLGQRWGPWSPLPGNDWCQVIQAELSALGRDSGVPDDVEHADAMLASTRAHALRNGADQALIATSIVRTGGWPGQGEIAVDLAARALDCALSRINDIDPSTDNDEVVEAIICGITPPTELLAQWARDASFGRLEVPQGSVSTGADMLRQAAKWLSWSVAVAAVDVVAAIRQSSAARS